MTIERHFDAHKLNEIANHPDVLKWVGAGAESLDASEIAKDLANYVLMTDRGGVFYHAHGDGIYEAHSQYLPEARGQEALRTTLESIEYMFSRTDCEQIISAVPKGNFAAAALAKACGLKFDFEQPDAWPKDGKMIPARWYSIKKSDWKRKEQCL